MLLEIGLPQVTAVRLHEHVNLVRYLAFVISVASFVANQTQALAERGILENIASCRSASLAVKGIGLQKSAGQLAVEGYAAGPVPSDQLGHRETFFCVTNCSGEIVA